MDISAEQELVERKISYLLECVPTKLLKKLVRPINMDDLPARTQRDLVSKNFSYVGDAAVLVKTNMVRNCGPEAASHVRNNVLRPLKLDYAMHAPYWPALDDPLRDLVITGAVRALAKNEAALRVKPSPTVKERLAYSRLPPPVRPFVNNDSFDLKTPRGRLVALSFSNNRPR
ncbi:MAG: hypothetical protein KGI97_08220 [Alphaproteobacteria bacterium]|nr:hypothetical protein [Alphaproteobacteria bacterium]